MKNYKLRKLLTLAAVAFVTSVALLPTKASAAWKQSDSGNWSYIEGNASFSGWKSIDGRWYFFDSNGIMKTGWILDGSTWYYTAPSGEMKTGWINDGGKWYYTATSGAMQTGWLSSNGIWYYLNTLGDMQTGLVDINGKTYYLSESGAMQTGNVTVNGVNYNFAANGEKISSANTQATTTQIPDAAKDNSSVSAGSGGSGGGSGSSGTKTLYYKSLYGTWSVKEYIPSNIKLTLPEEYKSYISLSIGQEFTIESDKISSIYQTISNPKIKESTITASDFSEKWGDTFENIGISGTEVKSVHISDSSKSSRYVDIFIADDEKVYALVKGALFELEKQ